MRLRNLAAASVGMAYLTMLLGSYVKGIGARQACPDWPLCYGQLIPPFGGAEGFTGAQIAFEWSHRLVAGLVVVLTVWLFVEIRRKYRDQENLVTLSILALGLLLTQVVLGAATVGGVDPLISVIHLGMAVAFFSTLVLLTAFVWRLRGPTNDATAPPGAQGSTDADETGSLQRPRAAPLAVVGDYLSILKPRILTLLLVGAIASMLVAVGTAFDPWVAAAALLGGAFAAGAGNAFNMYLERDIDALMTRTRDRPIPSGRVPARHVLAYGICLSLLSLVVLATFVNALTAILALSGAIFYIVVYTIWLKRTRPSNIVIGGAAGSFPVLVGWAAVTGQLQWPALALGFIIFLWTPPHFWAIAILRKEEYANAKIPMLPVVKGDAVTTQQIFLYSIATMIATSTLYLLGVLSAWYLLAVMALGSVFVWFAYQLLRDVTRQRAQRLFRFSIMYLGLVFVAMAADAVYVVHVV